MLKHLFTLLSWGMIAHCGAQTLVGSGSGTATNATISVSYSIGEVATATLSNGQKIFTQGLQQPRYTVVTSVNDFFDTRYSFSVYPNPTTDEIRIKTDFKDFTRYSLYDLSGRLIQTDIFLNPVIDFRKAPNGTYMLQLLAKEPQFSKTIQIIKQ